MDISFDNLRQAEGILDNLNEIKEKVEQRINLSYRANNEKRVILTGNKIMRICLIVGLYQTEQRDLNCLNEIQLSKSSIRIPSSFFTYLELKDLFGALLKMRYKEFDVNWNDSPTVSRIIASEMYRGRDYLMKEDNLNSFLLAQTNGANAKRGGIPALQLVIGQYDEDMEAVLDINSRGISNSQILVAGTTGSGKTNLLALLINQFRQLSVETPYPVNFLLFDYKGEFSDPANNSWLNKFDVDRSCILDPIKAPLPFTPFKDFRNRPIQEIILYSTEMSKALCSLDRATLSANMSNRLSEAITEAYKDTKGAPISFKLMLDKYQERMSTDRDDSVTSVLKQLDRANLFAAEDTVNLVKDSFIIKMDAYPKDGPIAKGIVYFVISKLNNIYEKLEKQEVSEDCVEIRHFTIIDEAHYMLSFDNRPLRNLIAVGRNKGLSIILATQNMDDFKSNTFDFYANAQYPLIMKQQSISDGVVKDLFGVSGKEFFDLKAAIASLQKGELIIKDNTAAILGIGNKWKRIKVTRII